MDVIASFKDREIGAVIDPTVAAFAPLLKAKKTFIKAVEKRTFKYGETDRHQLDVFYPPPGAHFDADKKEQVPVLFFVYGGGFNTGERSIAPRTFGLVYACVAAFFARRGCVVVVPDYRLVPHVVFPGGAEDVRDAVRWAIVNPACLRLDAAEGAEPALDRIALLAHSAGAAHVATMLFNHGVLPADDPLRVRIRAVALQAPPYDLSGMTAAWPTAHVHAAYWTSLEAAHAADPLHLYRALSEAEANALPALLMVEGEREPDWLIAAGDAFVKEVKGKVGVVPQRVVAKGHNHISLNWALSTGEGEEWGEEVMEWLKKQLA
ncbi:hypothetical protein HYPSUDRAFT_58130 [Hypholoma sublateritium FD-334 SS-4]|uniref:BD-FAE-like domain-containing protein n=1 Tax=Hypholoma sublateritium (strain FD-334 SS-4) TaxID=945553 RepID=A0A0D2M057_HYPSF|nr:hypothetical protein HYPSUDRAFT_58130 [Hypholoma sublateritium FD-334 SS-4]